MADRNKDPCRVQLKDVRIGHPNVFTARGFGKTNSGEKAFSAQFYIDEAASLGKRNIALCEDAIEAAKEKEFGEDKKKWPKIKRDNMPVFFGSDLDEDECKPEWEGMFVVRARNKKRPLVLDRDKTELDESDGRPYGGCFVDAIVRFWAQTYEGIPRVNCQLEAVRFRRDGEAFGAAPIDPDEFDDLDDEDDDGARSSRRRSRDEDDERPSRRRSRDEDDEDRGSGRRRSRGDDEGDDRGSRRRSRDDDDEDRGSARRRSRGDEEEDDRGSRRRRSRDEDDEEEDRPPRNSRARRSRDDDDI